ncbi:hypothetical protein BGW38_002330 [Lunasporangiospora selenospora]|uniref:Uncharacterized protein n=1 Tax=Lunasporangiospora selenospora TaxID=979761 RepID=A0A9P6FTE8_9FUNG|nr:hypothetical protein BGW38_002330 [Lunasporangiospora selenospora]
MLINVLIDFVIGLLPWVGDFLDIFYKSNQYNLTLFANWLEENQLVDVAKYDYDHPLSNDYRRSGRYRTRGSTAAAGSFGTSAHSSR